MFKKFSRILMSSAFAVGLMFTPIYNAQSVAQAALAIQDNRAAADYWTSKNSSGNAVQVAASDLEMLNLQIRQKSSGAIVDLAAYPEKVYPQWIKGKLTSTMTLGGFDKAEVPALFKDAAPLTEFSFVQAKKNCGLDVVPAVCTVRYALTIDRTNIRLLPEDDGWFESKDDTYSDKLQATALDPCEPVVVLVDSQDKKFVFVESRTASGWVKPDKLAFTDKTTWLKYVAPKNYLTILASRKTIPQGKAFFQMGGKVLLRAVDIQKDNSWAIYMPSIDANGTIIEQGLNVANDNNVVKGALPVTENNIIKQAFRFLGEGSNPGGLSNNVDNASFVQDVYRSVGIELPSDIAKQEKVMARSISLKGMNREQRLDILKKSKAGSLLFAPDHVMIYLGTDDKGEPLAIHAIGSYFTFEDGKTVQRNVRKVVVSDLHFMSRDKVEMIDRITSIGNF